MRLQLPLLIAIVRECAKGDESCVELYEYAFT